MAKMLELVQATRSFSTGDVSLGGGQILEVWDNNPYLDQLEKLMDEGYIKQYIPPVYPEGTLKISENGKFDVSEYAMALVNVGGSVETKKIKIQNNAGAFSVSYHTVVDGKMVMKDSAGVNPYTSITVDCASFYDVMNTPREAIILTTSSELYGLKATMTNGKADVVSLGKALTAWNTGAKWLYLLLLGSTTGTSSNVWDVTLSL